MNRDHRIYRRSTLIQAGIDEETVDSLEILSYEGKDDRFQLITSGLQLPACSFVSRTYDDVWFIDTGVDFDDGRMYVGEKDFSGMASVAGYVSKSSVGRIYEENERLGAELDLARALIIDLRDAVAGLVGAPSLAGNPIPRIRERANQGESPAFGDETDLENLDLDSL